MATFSGKFESKSFVRTTPLRQAKHWLLALSVILASFLLTGDSRSAPSGPGGLCCLCMCHSTDENQCARACVKMQHGTRIIDEPEMEACTRSCQRKGVKQIYFAEDGSYVVVTPENLSAKPASAQ